ncbi:MAG TPA: hypothetical protein DCO65_03295 [Spartobacteria bacterium]|nr:hypothetical protein [Spartobacteria bacterium]
MNAESKNQKGKSAAENKRGNSEYGQRKYSLKLPLRKPFAKPKTGCRSYCRRCRRRVACLNDSRARLTGMPPPS